MPKRLLSASTDWECVKREAATDAPMDEQTGPYDPNDTSAVSAYWQQATGNCHLWLWQASRGSQAPDPEHACGC